MKKMSTANDAMRKEHQSDIKRISAVCEALKRDIQNIQTETTKISQSKDNVQNVVKVNEKLS